MSYKGIVDFILPYISDYFIDIKKEDIHQNLINGKLKLENLTINHQMFNENFYHKIPIKIDSLTISEFLIELPNILKITKESVQIIIKDVNLKVSFYDTDELKKYNFLFSYKEKQAYLEKMKKDILDSLKKSDAHGSLIAGIISSIIPIPLIRIPSCIESFYFVIISIVFAC